MDTLDILSVMGGHNKTKKYFNGVFASDNLPKKNVQKPSCFVINTDPSSKPGTHWVAIYICGNGRAEYFDSFGLKPKLKSILRFLSRFSSGYTYNRKQLQNIFSTVCGNYCCEYLLHRCQGKSKSLFLKKYKSNETTANDKLTMKNFKTHFIKKQVIKR